MGCSASKKLEQMLMDSPLFNSLVQRSFHDSVAVAHHSSPSPSVYLFQLLAAASQIYSLIPPTTQPPGPGAQGQGQEHENGDSGGVAHDDDGDDDVEQEDVVSLIKLKWLPSPPSQADVDRTLRSEGRLSGKPALSRDEFFLFARCLFRDMAMASAERWLIAVYVPAGAITVLCAHLTLGKLPFVGPMYRSAGLLTPGLLLGSIVGAFAALGSRFP